MSQAEPVQSPFAIIPWQVAADDRLTKRHLKVLIALLSFRDSRTGPFWATRAQIAARCGLPESRISSITSELVDLGILRKHGAGHVAVHYEFLGCPAGATVPETVTVTKPVTVTDSATVTKTVTVEPPTVTKTVTQPLPKRSPSETRTEKDQDQERSRNGSRLPDDWRPSPKDRAFAERAGVPVDREADKFRDYWRSVSGAKAYRSDWPAVWRNWIRREPEFRGRSTQPPEIVSTAATRRLA